MLIETVKRTIRQHELIKENMHIVLGLSGGPDSVCLFHVLLRLREEWGLTIHPVHINHGFRPGAAEADQAYVETLCRDHGISCRSFVVDCGKMADELGMTGEEAGRKARYDAFFQVAEEVAQSGAFVGIAVAQNADDQAETILFRILRGTGTHGLAGMAYKRDERGFPVIRPLLDVYRKEIEDYCRSNALTPVTDHTNSLPLYTRNKIRLELLPYLEEQYNAKMKETLVRMGSIAAEDRDYLWQAAESAYRQWAIDGPKEEPDPTIITGSRQKLLALHPAIRHRVLLKAFSQIGLDYDLTRERLQAVDRVLESEAGGEQKVIQFPHGYRIRMGAETIELLRGSEPQTISPLPTGKLSVELVEDPQKVAWFKTQLRAPEGIRREAIFDEEKLPEIFHKERLLRTRQAGDFMRLGGGTKKLKKFFIDEKIPEEKRDQILLLAAGNEIFWIFHQGLGLCRFAERYKVDEATKRLIIVKVL